MKKPDVDERTVAVDNAAGNLGYRVMAWLLVADLAVHGLWPDLVSLRGVSPGHSRHPGGGVARLDLVPRAG